MMFMEFGGLPMTPSDRLTISITDAVLLESIEHTLLSQIAKFRPLLKSAWSIAPEVHLNELPSRLPTTPLTDEVLEV